MALQRYRVDAFLPGVQVTLPISPLLYECFCNYEQFWPCRHIENALSYRSFYLCTIFLYFSLKVMNVAQCNILNDVLHLIKFSILWWK